MNNVLTDDHYRKINKGLNALANGRRLIEMAKQAGQDMSQYEESYDNVERQLKGYKSVFFSDRA